MLRIAAAARDVLKALAGAWKTMSSAHRDTAISDRYLGALGEELRLYFAQHERLSLVVEPFALRTSGREVWASEDTQDNLPLTLWLGGIRELTLLRGIAPREVETLLEIVRAGAADSGEENLMTRLWDRNLPHVRYLVSSRFDRASALLEERFLGVAASVLAPGAVAVVTPRRHGKSGPLTSDEELGAIRKRLEPFRAECDTFGGDWLRGPAVRLFLDLMAMESDPLASLVLARSIVRVADAWIQQHAARQLLGVLVGVEQQLARGLPREADELLRDLCSRLSSRQMIISFLDNLPVELSGEYLRIIARSARTGLVDVLGKVEERAHRELIVQALVPLVKDHLALFVAGLRDERWFLVRNLVSVLGLSKDPRVIEALGTVVGHTDVPVRRECALSLGQLGHAEAVAPLEKLLEDPDEGVRLTAVEALEKSRHRESARALLRRAEVRAFRLTAPAEKRRLFEAIASFGTAEVEEALVEIFSRRTVLGLTDRNDVRVAAAYGLGRLATRVTLRLLRTEAESGRSPVKEACQEALQMQGGHVT